MALTESPKGELGSVAPDFLLPGVDGRTWSLESFKNQRGLLVAFICNHCPYVQAIEGRLSQLGREYHGKGVSIIAINSNDAMRYPADDFSAMKVRAQEAGYVFPYCFDESQDVARAYGAVCTPDFFYHENSGGVFRLSYRGRLDDHWKDPTLVKRQDLRDCFERTLRGESISRDQISSMGCSIKWKS